MQVASLSTSVRSFDVSSLPIYSLLSRHLPRFDSLLLHKPDVEDDEFVLSIDSLPLHQPRFRGDVATTTTSFI